MGKVAELARYRCRPLTEEEQEALLLRCKAECEAGLDVGDHPRVVAWYLLFEAIDQGRISGPRDT